MKLFCLDAADPGVSYYRQSIFARRMAEEGHQVTVSHTLVPEFLHSTQIVHMVGINPNSISLELIQVIRSKGIKVVWDIDDACFHIGPHHPQGSRRLLWSATYKTFIRSLLQSIDGLFVTTRAVQDYFRPFTKAPIFVVPNCLDEKLWSTIHKPDFKWGDKPIVGWAGGQSHILDLEMMKDVILALGQKDYIFRFIGYYPESLAGTSFIEYVEWSPDVHIYYQSLALSGFDVCVAPLQNTMFNLHKSNIKLLEYSAYCGVPILASEIGPYKNTPVPGVKLVKEDTKKWVSEIEAAVNESRSKSRSYNLHTGWQLSVVVKEFIAALEKVLAAGHVSG